nr:TIM barrel protein [uncultured Allomuricauda sp.]
MKKYSTPLLFFLLVFIASCTGQSEEKIELKNIYPWCIVAFDSIERSPAERIQMLKDLGFSKYAYDWRNKDLDEMETELDLAKENQIEVISVWFWLNAKRDSLGKLSPANNRVLEIIKHSKLKTTLWLSFSPNFFEGKTQEESMALTLEMIKFVHAKAKEIGCKVALYNHRGWFGNPSNQVELIKMLPQCNLSMVYNFHHAHEYLDDFPQIVKEIKPYLTAVNLNGMRKKGPKILPIGEGNEEKGMINMLINSGFVGPWGVLGHVEHKDVQQILEQNIKGLHALKVNWHQNNKR